MTIMKDIKQGESLKVGNEMPFLYDGVYLPEMSGKCKSNQTKTNNLMYIMIFFLGGGVVKNLGSATLKKFTPLQNPYLRP